MSFSLLHKSVAYLLSGLGLIALSLGSELSPLALALIFAGYVGSWFAEESLHSRPHYAPAWTGAVVACLAIQIARALISGPTLAMAMEFAAFLQLSRLFNRRTAADYQQIAVLGFLHLIAATVLSTNLSYAIIFVGFLISTPWMLALSHLRKEIEGNYPPQNDADPNARTAIRRVLASKRVVGPGFLVGTALLALPLFAMTLAVFVIVPRVGQGFLTFRRSEGQRVAGFGNQVELGGFGVIRDDPTVVVRVMPLPQGNQPPTRVMRLRGTSFDHYDGRRWTRKGPTTPTARSARSIFPLRRLPDQEHDEQLKIVLEHLDEPVVFLPSGTVAISVPPRVVRGVEVRREISYGAGLDLRYSDADGLGLNYTAFVSRRGADFDLPAMPSEQRAQYLQVPKGHERVAQLAREVVGSAEDDAQRALRIERYLKEGRFRYSLEQPEVGKRLPLEVFLFDAKRGHCEYFSSAMAIMLRSLGVATRNVAGFAGGRYNPYGHYYALRQGDAHSWVEVYLKGRGWVTFDPTPASRAAVGPRERLWSDLNALIDALRMRWSASIVGYDLNTQIGMLERMKRWFAALQAARGQGDNETAEPGAPKQSNADDAGNARLLIAAVVGLLLIGLVLRKLRRRRRAGPRPASRQQAQVVALYTELERALARRGYPRPAALTPLEHARKLQEQGFSHASTVGAITERYLEARYGARALEHVELSELRRAIARLRKAA